MTQVLPRGASRPVKAAVALAFTVAVLGLWIYGSARVPNYILPSPRTVLDTAISFFNSPRSLGHLFSTLTVVGISISLSFGVGALLALISYYVSWLRPLIDHPAAVCDHKFERRPGGSRRRIARNGAELRAVALADFPSDCRTSAAAI